MRIYFHSFFKSNGFIYCVILFSKTLFSFVVRRDIEHCVFPAIVLVTNVQQERRIYSFQYSIFIFPNVWAIMKQSRRFLTQSLPPVRVSRLSLRRNRFTLSKWHYELCWLESKPFNKSLSQLYISCTNKTFVCPKDIHDLQFQKTPMNYLFTKTPEQRSMFHNHE